ncbi:MAG: hypothetical protein MJ124_03185 [Lachnospiraceae bacterium]|nr:hypothetical protein [Lachnospiraceae bacterium]
MMKKKIKKVSAFLLSLLLMVTMLSGMGATTVKAAEKDEYTAFLMFSDRNWAFGNWSADNASATTKVTGAGTYTVKLDAATVGGDGEAKAAGAMVFCVDILDFGYHAESIGVDYLVKNVKIKADGAEFPIDESKIAYGDIEDNGNLRIEIFNEYGSTQADPAFDPTALSFAKDLEVTFTLEEKRNTAFLMFSDRNWAFGNWDATEDNSIVVNGAGTYTVELDATKVGGDGETKAAGAQVFCVDIAGFQKKAAAAGKTFEVQDVKITADGVDFPIDATKVLAGDIEENGNLRIELYNEYGATQGDPAFDPTTLAFAKKLAVTFTLAEKPVNAFLMFTDRNWAFGNWDATADNSIAVNGAGTYTVKLDATKVGGDGETKAAGAQVFCVDIAGFTNWAKAQGKDFEVKDVVIKADGADFAIDASKVVYGDIEENGNLRIELYNEYGATQADPAFDPTTLSFAKELTVSFTLAEKAQEARLIFCDRNWAYSIWDSTANNTCKFNGDGTYTLTLKNADIKGDATAPVTGAMVFCVDVLGLHNVIEHVDEVHVYNVIVKADGVEVPVDQSKIVVGDIEENGNVRFEIYNEYGKTAGDGAIDVNAFTFADTLEVTFTIDGVHYGRNVEKAPAAEPYDVEAGKQGQYNAYFWFQTDDYTFRNNWDDDSYGLVAYEADNSKDNFYHVTGWGANNEELNLGGTFIDADITCDGTYSVAMYGFDNLNASTKYNMLQISTNIPSQLVVDGTGVTITDVKASFDGGQDRKFTHIDTSGDYAVIMLLNTYQDAVGTEAIAYTIPEKSIVLTFTISGLANVNADGGNSAAVLAAVSGTPATEEPVPTEAPAVTEAPAPTEAPKATEAPAATDVPEAVPTQAPAAETKSSNVGLIVGIIGGVVVILGVAAFFVLKGKKKA